MQPKVAIPMLTWTAAAAKRPQRRRVNLLFTRVDETLTTGNPGRVVLVQRRSGSPGRSHPGSARPDGQHTMNSAVASLRNDESDIRDAARRAARRSGVSLGQWLDGVMTERADSLGMQLLDLDPAQRVAAIVARLNGPQAEEGPDSVAQPRAGLEPYALQAAAPVGSLDPPPGGTMLDDEPQEQVMREDMAVSFRLQEEPAAVPLTLTNAVAGPAADRQAEQLGVARRQAAQRVEIETKLNDLFAALERTPRRTDDGGSGDFDDAGDPVRRRRALLGDTAIVPSWRLEKAVTEIADRQAFLERQSADAGLVVKPSRGSQARAATESRRRPAPEPVPSMFSSLQGNLDRIARRLDAVHLDVTRRPAAPSEPTVQEMRTLLGEMRPDASIDVLGRQVEALSSKLDTVIEQGVPKTTLNQLSQRIEEVHTELAVRLAAGAAAAPVVDMAAIEHLIAAALDRAGQSAPAMPDLRPLEAAVQDLADKLQKAEQAQGDPTALAELHEQVGTLASRIDRSDVGLTAIVALERSMGAMFTQLGSMREASLEAAESTARVTAEETLKVAMAHPDFAAHMADSLSETALGQMSQDVAQLRADRDDADARLHAILAALNSSLERVVDRLGALEEEPPAGRPVTTTDVAPLPTVVDLAPPATTALDLSGPLEQAVALGVAERVEPSAPAPLDASPDFAVPPQTMPLEVRGLASRVRPAIVDEQAQLAPVNAPDPTSFIAAARRAAQAAMHDQREPWSADEADEAASLVAPSALLRSRFKIGMLSKSRPLLLAAAGLVLLIGIAQVVRTSLSDEPTGSIAGSDIVAAPPAPLAAPSPAPGPKADAGDDAESAAAIDTAAVSPTVSQEAYAPAKTEATAPAPVAAVATPGIIAKSDPTARAPLPTMAMGPAASIAALQAGEIASRSSTAGLAPGLRTQADSGVPGAQFEAGLRYADGRGVGRDLPMAARWFEKAAQQGLAPAAYRLGSLYEKGLGVARDPAKAIDWYRKAADAGNIRAMHNLAVLLAEGVIGKADYPAASSWFTKAAQAGVRDSQFNLAILYARGLGVAQNLSQSYTWFAIAAAQGDQDSVKKRDEVESHLDAATLEQAKATVAAFTPEPSVSAANEVPVPPGGWDATPPGANTATGAKLPANAHLSRM